MTMIRLNIFCNKKFGWDDSYIPIIISYSDRYDIIDITDVGSV